mmetsp:Transcript_408/g.764  ORF Transcript_408/g.764 Transcript_408/m.764 type:complete len:233 (-) Transcript_408:1118-1816(-)
MANLMSSSSYSRASALYRLGVKSFLVNRIKRGWYGPSRTQAGNVISSMGFMDFTSKLESKSWAYFVISSCVFSFSYVSTVSTSSLFTPPGNTLMSGKLLTSNFFASSSFSSAEQSTTPNLTIPFRSFWLFSKSSWKASHVGQSFGPATKATMKKDRLSITSLSNVEAVMSATVSFWCPLLATAACGLGADLNSLLKPLQRSVSADKRGKLPPLCIGTVLIFPFCTPVRYSEI